MKRNRPDTMIPVAGNVWGGAAEESDSSSDWRVAAKVYNIFMLLLSILAFIIYI